MSSADDKKEHNQVEIIPPNYSLKKRTHSENGSGFTRHQAVERASNIVKSHADMFYQAASESIEEMFSLWQKIQINDEDREKNFTNLIRLTHDLRGQGGTFDYPYITRIAAFLHMALEKRDFSYPKYFELLHVHISALSSILKGKMTGEDNKDAQKLATGCELIVQKLVGSLK
ncbi:MAG: hypothetical protein ACOYK8_00110 [Alphaproteobacteria bacterium]